MRLSHAHGPHEGGGSIPPVRNRGRSRSTALPRLAALVLLGLVGSARSDTSETVFFLSDDLTSGTQYYSARMDDAGNQSYLFDRDYDRRLVLYARPENYRWRTTVHRREEMAELHFPSTASYAYLRRLPDAEDFLKKLSATSYTLSVDGSQCIAEGCTMDENIISVVMPKRFKVRKYEARVAGNWKVVDNTYTFYARNVKGAAVTLEFEDSHAAMFDRVNATMAQLQGVEVRNVEGTIKIVMPMDNVFAPGGVTMRAQGATWVKSLAQSLKGAAVREIRIEGHADSTPIKSAVYPSNWELSAARAAQALRVFLGEGIEASKLMAAGFADSRPLSEGDSTEARAKNRRIEFTVVPQSP
jgi:flagellar motor protein MotB